MRGPGIFGATMRKSGIKLLLLAAPFSLPFLGGCGAVSSAAGSGGPGGLVISAEKAAVDTATTDQLTARMGSGGPASVKWTVASGQNDAPLGQGTVSASGLYTPPPLLSRDQVQVQVVATSRSDPAATAS